MAKDKRPRRLFRKIERVSSYKNDRSSSARMKSMTRGHQDVLQNVEFVLVTSHRQDSTVDDKIVAEALRASINQTESTGKVAEIVDALASIREFRSDIDDSVWRDALIVVLDSVRRHSQLRPGETGYLDFVARFIP
jgi:hypothetical protein